MIKPTVYLVGAGPGDSKLITVRALELIKDADCIIYDYLVNSTLLKFRKKDCRLIYAGKRAGTHTLPQDKINELLAKEAKTYSKIVRLKGGDPFIFGRGAEEALYLKKKKINFEVVPGITSAIAVPAYAGIPLTERSRTSTVGFITGHEDPAKLDSSINWEALAGALGTMVFLMGVSNLDLIARKLMASGKPKNTPVALIRWGTTVKQKTITGNLGNISRLARKNKISPPAIIVVGENVALRKELDWFEKKPLFGKKIIVTRTRNQASIFSEKLTSLGAEVIEIPTIKVVSLKSDKPLKDAFLSGAYDWVFFTSQNGVDELARFLERIGMDSRIFGKAKICAIGTETAKSLKTIGIIPDYIPKQFVAEEIVRYFKNRDRHYFSETKRTSKNSACPYFNGTALILRAKKARDILPEGLREAGFKVKIIDLYDTLLPQESAQTLKETLQERIDFVTFTSSSTVENFVKLMGKDYRKKLSCVKFASIGPVTSATLRKFGLKADVEAKVYTIDGLADAIVRKYD